MSTLLSPTAGTDGANTNPTTFQRFKAAYGEYVAEAIGAGTIVLFGAGAQLQTQLYAGSPVTSHLGKHPRKPSQKTTLGMHHIKPQPSSLTLSLSPPPQTRNHQAGPSELPSPPT